MSLQIAAQHLASRGRGPDTQLVHMAPQEVAGLHALARAHGGELTTNPDTGLPEAGFLSSLLPMVLGAGAMMVPGLQGLGAGWIGAGIGGATALATGSLQKGLMAGLGAYGGAGLAGGLTAAGAGIAPGIAGTTEAMAGGFGPGAVAPVAPPVAPVAPMAGPDIFGGTAGEIGAAYGYTPPPAAAAAAAPSPIQAQQAVMEAAPQTVTSAPATTAPAGTSFSDRFAQAGRGLSALGTEAGREAFMSAQGVGGLGGLAKYGGAAALPLLMQEPKKQAEKEKLKPYEYTYSPGRVQDPEAGYTGAFTGERTYFNPSFTRVGNYAEGGSTKAVPPVEEDPYYTMSGQSGDMYKYLMGQMPSAPAPAQAAPAPVQAAPASAPAAAPARSGLFGQTGSTESLLKSYTFDPATGSFTPITPTTPAAYDTSAAYGLYPMSSFGGPGGSVGPATAPGGEGGMSNQGEGGPGSVGGWAVGGLAALAQGGQSHLGDYSDGGRMLRGPGDGVSDSIPATIGGKRPARLADGEFVVPARIVSELGNGSSEAGARKLYAMMDRVQKARGKTTGKDRVAVNSRAEKMLPV